MQGVKDQHHHYFEFLTLHHGHTKYSIYLSTLLTFFSMSFWHLVILKKTAFITEMVLIILGKFDTKTLGVELGHKKYAIFGM